MRELALPSASHRQFVENGTVNAAVSKRTMELNDLFTIVGMALFEELMQPAETIVRDGREEVVRNVHILPVHKNRPACKRVGEEDPCVGQPAKVGVRVLVDIAQEHEEGERRHQRCGPQNPEVKRGPPVRRGAQQSESYEKPREVRQPQDPGGLVRIGLAERRPEEGPRGQRRATAMTSNVPNSPS